MKLKYATTFAIASILGLGLATACGEPEAGQETTPAGETQADPCGAKPCAGADKADPCAAKPCAGK